MAKLILKYDDGRETLVRGDLPENTIPGDILIRSDYFATKLWCEEDIQQFLLEKGYEDSEENVALILNTGVLRRLEDCTDQDWDCIEYAYHMAVDRLKKK